MFEAAELGQKLSKQAFQQQVPGLRTALLEAQFALREREFPVIVLISGDDRPSCHHVLNRIAEWMDPRFLEANAYAVPTDEERERPFFWRYWRSLPPRGRVGLFARGWVMQAIVLRMLEEIDEREFDLILAHVRAFERGLIADGALVLKFWLHLPREEFRRSLRRSRERPTRDWRAAAHDMRIFKNYRRGMALMERALRSTETAICPWHLVESTDARYRDVTVAGTILAALAERLRSEVPLRSDVPEVTTQRRRSAGPTVLDRVDLARELPKREYDAALKRWQSKLFRLTREAADTGLATVLVFEGWDAAGKGGIIRRLTTAMDAGLYRVVSTSAPTEEERSHHYLWRFWRQLPRAGRVTVFDRSWYGRVLVERVEGFAERGEWSRAYVEINDFEDQLTEHGIVLLKFWLHIDPEEQLRRFRQREETAFKRHKITEEDYRNREKWNEYEEAVTEMIERTSTDRVRWRLVPANDKRWARIEVLKSVCKRLREALR